jgi:hypothetical protein
MTHTNVVRIGFDPYDWHPDQEALIGMADSMGISCLISASCARDENRSHARRIPRMP